MKKTISSLTLLIIIGAISLTAHHFNLLNTYIDKELGFTFTYPKKTYVYAIDKTATNAFGIVFSIPDARATEIPLARIDVSTHDAYTFPTRNLSETRDNYPFEGFNKLTSEKIIKEDPLVIEFVWTDSKLASAVYKEYRVIKINKKNVNYFDLYIGQGFTPQQLKETALSFKFE